MNWNGYIEQDKKNLLSILCGKTMWTFWNYSILWPNFEKKNFLEVMQSNSQPNWYLLARKAQKSRLVTNLTKIYVLVIHPIPWKMKVWLVIGVNASINHTPFEGTRCDWTQIHIQTILFSKAITAYAQCRKKRWNIIEETKK